MTKRLKRLIHRLRSAASHKVVVRKARELKEIDVRMISLVKVGANRKSLIYKGETFNEDFLIPLTKTDDEKGIVYGIVYAPDETDTQGDRASAEEIEKAAHRFLRGGNVYAVDVEHSFAPVDAYICESWIVKEGDPFFKEVGAWAVGIKVESEEIRKAIKSGEINALSMYGAAQVAKRSLGDELKAALKEFFAKEAKEKNQTKEVDLNEEQVKAVIKTAIDEAIASLDAKIAEAVKPIGEKLEAVVTKSAALEAELSKSKQDKNPPNNDGGDNDGEGIL
ncbi:MAG: XkdF-like putative serine protease domain-containing protein [Helicobacteraceae bacterium]|nr:XkdF-like putative serine protease domain-containing protein [Helicobacteraceae bacterium]